MKKLKNKPVIRWIDDDGAEPELVAELLSSCGTHMWTKHDVSRFMRMPDHIPKVIVVDDKIVGCCLYILRPNYLYIVALAVIPSAQRQTYGSQLIKTLKRALPALRRNKLITAIPAWNLTAQLFFKHNKFRWIRTMRKDQADEAYAMEFSS